MVRSVYLDYNATVPIRPEAAAAVAGALELCGNASSVHGFGRLARRCIETARDQVAALIAARPEQVVFTSGGTEANNLALTGTDRTRLIVSAGEHDSVLKAAPQAERIPLDSGGRVDLDALSALLTADTRPALVSVMLANNETGVIQPLAEVAALTRAHDALLHVDAVQAAGKIPIDRQSAPADLLSLSAHKLGGPQGVGALMVVDRVVLKPLIAGGGQERARRAGTENLPGIAGFGAAAEAACAALADAGRLTAMRDRLEQGLCASAPDIRIFGAGAERLANTSCFATPGLPAETQVMSLDLAGIAVSAGSACSSGKVRPSHVLLAMGASAEEAGSAIRVSLGWQSGTNDVERFLKAWKAIRARRDAGSYAGTPAA